VPKLGSGGVGKARRIAAAGVSAQDVEEDIMFSLCQIEASWGSLA
jgi:hypothetical protein